MIDPRPNGRLDTGLCFLFFTVVIASAWGIRVGLVSAAANYLCLDYFFVPPLHRLVLHDPKNLGSWIPEISVFTMTAIVVGRPGHGPRATRREGVDVIATAGASGLLFTDAGDLRPGGDVAALLGSPSSRRC